MILKMAICINKQAKNSSLCTHIMHTFMIFWNCISWEVYLKWSKIYRLLIYCSFVYRMHIFRFSLFCNLPDICGTYGLWTRVQRKLPSRLDFWSLVFKPVVSSFESVWNFIFHLQKQTDFECCHLKIFLCLPIFNQCDYKLSKAHLQSL